MNALSLCSGIGGLDLGLRLAVPDYEPICYVELDPFCQEILLARMADGSLPPAPLWDDLRTFDGRPWRGLVDGVVSGFPCQPFSLAGKRKGEADARNLWPDVRRIIVESDPAVVVLENVPGAMPYFFHVVLPELSGLGYVTQAGLFTAAEVGAPHKRERLFCVANAGLAVIQQAETGRSAGAQGIAAQRSGRSLGDPELARRETPGIGRDEHTRAEPETGGGDLPPWPPGPTERDRWAVLLARWPELAPAVAEPSVEQIRAARQSRMDAAGENEAQQSVRDVADGIPVRMGLEKTARTAQLRALGNAVVPAVAALAWRMLTRPRAPMKGGR